MSETTRQDLFDKANELALDFPKNIATAKLEAMIAEASGPTVSTGEQEQEPEVAVVAAAKPTKLQARRAFIAQRKKVALKTSVVTITNRDSRDNDVTTTAYLSFENQYFGVSKNVPLDVAVELEQALIDIAESTTITLHKDEVIDGKRTGNKVAISVKKYVVSYAKG